MSLDLLNLRFMALADYLLITTLDNHSSRCPTAVNMQSKVRSIIIIGVHISSAVQVDVLTDVLSS